MVNVSVPPSQMSTVMLPAPPVRLAMQLNVQDPFSVITLFKRMLLAAPATVTNPLYKSEYVVVGTPIMLLIVVSDPKVFFVIVPRAKALTPNSTGTKPSSYM